MNKIRLAVMFGGRSGEHEVSLSSARSVLSVLSPEKYEVTQIGITHSGQWLSGPDALTAFEQQRYDQLVPVVLLPELNRHTLYRINFNGTGPGLLPYADIDCVFPVLHGTFGEDGAMQGLLELNGIAYVGAGVTGSAIGMDKGLFKDIMRANQIPVLPALVTNRFEIEKDIQKVIAGAEKELGAYPYFTKPVNLGSSVGITKIRSRSDLYEGLLEAARFDRRVLIEKGLNNPREIEVSVLGNEEPVASLPGEIRPSDDFYSYRAKYIDDRSELLIPAPISDQLAQQVKELAVRIYRSVDCAGMARVDFLLDRETDQLYISEINTIPGFTKISMYPKLWEASGLPYAALVERLVELAYQRQAERRRTEYQFRRDQ